MKKLTVLLILSFFLVACSGEEGEGAQEDEDVKRIFEVLHAHAEFAAYYFERLQSMWDEDNGEMWGVSLHTPVVIFCTESSAFAANRPDKEGEFSKLYIDGIEVFAGIRRVGGLPELSRHDWNGQTGVFISKQYMQTVQSHYIGTFNNPSTVSLMTMNHYALHALQPTLMNVSGSFRPAVMDESAWISYILEISALIYAINNSGQEKLSAINDALSIRQARREAFNITNTENLMQVSEGTAIYTELHMLFTRTEIEKIIQSWPEMFIMAGSAYDAAMVYCYNSVTLYGMLLDDLGVYWRHDVWSDTDFGIILKNALGITELMSHDEIDLERYGHSNIINQVQR